MNTMSSRYKNSYHKNENRKYSNTKEVDKEN